MQIGDQLETVHVKNTGRCRELLVPEAEVILEKSDNPARKTKYDLHMSDKTVRPVFEYTSDRILIIHSFSLVTLTIT